MSEENPADPYRFGPPEPAVVARYSQPTGRAILRSTWQLLRADKAMIWLSLLGNVASLAAFAALFVPGFVAVDVLGHNENAAGITGAVLGVLMGSIVAIYFQAALVIGANQRADGMTPTFGGVLAEAWTLRWRIVQWALVTTTVGLVIRVVEERLGILGRIVGFLGAIAWAIASFFVVPVLVAERLGPIDAVKYSARLIKHTWGTSIRTTLRWGVMQFFLTLIPLGLTFIGIFVLLAGIDGQTGLAPVGAVMIVAGVLSLFVLSATFGAVSVYSRALIYRWAQNRPVPGLDASLFDGAFVEKRRRRR